MQIKANQLGRHLDAGRFAPIYLVYGDEPLLVDEACASIVEAAEANGFSDRSRFDLAIDGSLDEALAGAANLSLFASKRMLDIRLPAKGLDRKGSDTIRRYLGSPPPSTMVLCRAPGLDWRTRSSAWHKAIDKAGAVVQVWPVSARELPRWLDQRCRASGLQLDREALSILADRVEGNLLAATQEIEKLRLSGRQGPIGAEEMRDAVGDSAHFDTFQMIDTAFAGQGRARLPHGAGAAAGRNPHLHGDGRAGEPTAPSAGSHRRWHAAAAAGTGTASHPRRQPARRRTDPRAAAHRCRAGPAIQGNAARGCLAVPGTDGGRDRGAATTMGWRIGRSICAWNASDALAPQVGGWRAP